jgi:hypothetical protein
VRQRSVSTSALRWPYGDGIPAVHGRRGAGGAAGHASHKSRPGWRSRQLAKGRKTIYDLGSHTVRVRAGRRAVSRLRSDQRQGQDQWLSVLIVLAGYLVASAAGATEEIDRGTTSRPRVCAVHALVTAGRAYRSNALRDLRRSDHPTAAVRAKLARTRRARSPVVHHWSIQPSGMSFRPSRQLFSATAS